MCEAIYDGGFWDLTLSKKRKRNVCLLKKSLNSNKLKKKNTGKAFTISYLVILLNCSNYKNLSLSSQIWKACKINFPLSPEMVWYYLCWRRDWRDWKHSLDVLVDVKSNAFICQEAYLLHPRPATVLDAEILTQMFRSMSYFVPPDINCWTASLNHLCEILS